MTGNMSRFHIRPARPDEAGLFYTPHPEEDKRRGTIGHIRMDFGRSGNEFWHTWWPRDPEELNSPVFKAELQEVVDTLREDVLKNRFAMERFCYEHGGKISGGWVQNYGYIVETERYRYCLRCNPSPGDYNGYLTAYDLDVQRQNMAQEKPLVGRVTYVKDCLYQTQYENLSIMFAGKYPPNPVELLSGQYFEELLKAAKESYDYVLIDVPPLGSVIDAAVVAAKCDGTILVISDNQVRYRQAIEVIEQLKKSESKILGIVRNNIKKKDGGYYKKYYKNRYQ